MKLRGVEIENFMGIQSAKFAVGDGGVQFVGKSKSGKSSMSLAIYAGLKSKGFGPECICDDADRWRVLLKFDTATVQTIVRRSGTKDVKVDGLGLGSPQAKLDAIFPDLIDPWKLAQDEPAVRRRKVLAAMPATATADDMKLWTGDDWTPAEGKHGLEVVREARDHYYALRTSANKDAEASALAHRQANEEAERLVALDALEPGAVFPLPGEEDAPVRAAEEARRRLDQRAADAEAMAKRTQWTRDKIEKLRADAEAKDDASQNGPEPTELVESAKEVEQGRADVAELKRRLGMAEGVLRAAEARNTKLRDADREAHKIEAEGVDLRRQASELESTLDAAGIAAPTPEEFEAADLAIAQANITSDRIRAARKTLAAIDKVADLGNKFAAAKVEAKRLDDIVKRLDKDAPTELAKRANLIPGLTFVGDDIALDGKVFKILSESEKTELCVDLVKRIAPEAKLLRIDRLEGMDPDMREDFIKRAKTGGWQILGTVVERGEMKIVTIDADGECEDAPITEIKTAKGNGKKRLTIVMPEGT
jgi:hypothetical protein